MDEQIPSFDETKPVPAATEQSDAPKFEDTVSATPSFDETVPLDSTPVNPQSDVDRSSPSEMTKTFAEGVGRGATFGASTLAEKAAGVRPEDIEARKKANPVTAALGDVTGTVGSMFAGVGEGAILAKGAKMLLPVAENMGAMTKIGRLALQGMLETSGMATGDEIGDALLDENKPATAIAGHIAASGALGLLTGGVGGAFSSTAKGLEAAQNSHLGAYLNDAAAGMGAAKKGPEAIESTREMFKLAGEKIPKGFEHGVKFYNETSNQIGKYLADTVAEYGAAAVGGAAGTAIGGSVLGIPTAVIAKDYAKKYLDPYAEKLVSKVTPAITKNVAVPIMLRAIKLGDSSGISSALNYGTKVARGNKLITSAIDNIFKAGGNKVIDQVTDENDNDKLDEHIKNGTLNQQMNELNNNVQDQNYATGGEVTQNPTISNGFSTMYPAQNMMLNAAKARVSTYLNSVRPLPDPNARTFDTPHTDPLKEKSYREALTIANKPLTVLNSLKKGTLRPSQMKHLTGMYPELHDHLSEKMTKRIMEKRMDDEKPPYKLRQSLSLFLGTSLDSTTEPSYIQAAQSVFAPKQAPQGQQQAQEQTKSKKGTAPLSKVSKDYQTPEQARAARANKS